MHAGINEMKSAVGHMKQVREKQIRNCKNCSGICRRAGADSAAAAAFPAVCWCCCYCYCCFCCCYRCCCCYCSWLVGYLWLCLCLCHCRPRTDDCQHADKCYGRRLALPQAGDAQRKSLRVRVRLCAMHWPRQMLILLWQMRKVGAEKSVVVSALSIP